MKGAGVMLFAGASPARLPLVAINTLLSACGAGLADAGVTRFRSGRPDAWLIANG